MTEPGKHGDQNQTTDTANRIRVLVHIADSRRGEMDMVPGGQTFIGTAYDATVHFDGERESTVGEYHAKLLAGHNETTIQALARRALFVNGKRIDQAVLAPDDVIQVGENGPVLRYRVYTGDLSPYKTPFEALRDCLTNGRYCGETPAGRVQAFARAVPGEMMQMSPTARWGMAMTMALMVVSMAGLGYHAYMLDQRLERRTSQIESVSAELTETRRQSVDTTALENLEQRLSGTLQRIDQLETSAGAVSRVIAEAAGSVVFIQGAYGFVDPDTGKRLRMALDDDGQPIEVSNGQVRVRVGGDGPAVERSYMGTGFVVGSDGVILTNRHIAEPWVFDDRAQTIMEHGLEPQRVRMIGYLPGKTDSFDIDFMASSQDVDLAVLQGEAIAGHTAPLQLAERSPEVGEEVILLGYPTGIQALIARADPALVQEIENEKDGDFRAIAASLADAEAIEPLATSGIVGQVTKDRVVYDAGTQGGGSGGPLLNHKGQVVAINQAMLRDFQGSNMGVPVERVRALLERARDGS